MAPVFGYWKIRGLAQSIRLLLEFSGEEYEDKFYTFGPVPDTFGKSDWKPVKFTLGLDFPNLPYYIEGDLKITQSAAILYHLARKHNLCGKTLKEKAYVDMLFNQVADMRSRYIKLVYGNWDTGKEEYMKTLADHLKLLSDYLGGKNWFVGGQVTLADFLIYEILDIHLEMDTNCLKDTKNLHKYHQRFQELPAMKKYMSSSRFIKAPLNGPTAKFANK